MPDDQYATKPSELFEVMVSIGPRRTRAGVIELAADVGKIRKSEEHGLEFRYSESWLSAHQRDPHTYFNIDPLLQTDTSWQRIDTGGFLDDAELGSFEWRCVPRKPLPLPLPLPPTSWSSAAESGVFRWNRWVQEITGLPASVRFGALQFSSSQPSYTAEAPPIPSLLQVRSATEKMRKALSGEEFRAPRFWAGPSLPGYDGDAKIAAMSGGRIVTCFLPLTETGGFSLLPVRMAIQLAIAKAAGITVCEFGMLKSKAPILCLERFDRDGPLMVPCMLATTAGKMRPFGLRSYVEMTDVISAWSSHSADDLQELWRRMVFGILANFTQSANTIALLWHHNGWRLAPLWHVEPPGGRIPKNLPNKEIAVEMREEAFLRTGSWPLYITGKREDITRKREAPSLAVALSVAHAFGLNQFDARAIAGEIAVAVRAWPQQAAVYKLRDASSLKLAAELYETEDLRTAYGFATKAQQIQRRGVGRG